MIPTVSQSSITLIQTYQTDRNGLILSAVHQYMSDSTLTPRGVLYLTIHYSSHTLVLLLLLLVQLLLLLLLPDYLSYKLKTVLVRESV